MVAPDTSMGAQVRWAYLRPFFVLEQGWAHFVIIAEGGEQTLPRLRIVQIENIKQPQERGIARSIAFNVQASIGSVVILVYRSVWLSGYGSTAHASASLQKTDRARHRQRSPVAGHWNERELRGTPL